MPAVARRPIATGRDVANLNSPCWKRSAGYLNKNRNSQPIGCSGGHSTSDVRRSGIREFVTRLGKGGRYLFLTGAASEKSSDGPARGAHARSRRSRDRTFA